MKNITKASDRLSDLKIILASQSPRRKMLLEQAGYNFEIVVSQAEELAASHDNVDRIVVQNAEIKGGEVARRLPESLQNTVVLAADTLVAMDRKVYGKPIDLNQALAFLRELGGKPHRVLTGVYLHSLQTSETLTFVDETLVTLKRLDDAAIRRLFEKVTPLDKAAGYGFQDAPEIIESMNGSETNVIGLPMEKLAETLSKLSD